MVAKDEGPYLGLWSDPRQTGIFEYLRTRLGVYDYGPDRLPETNLARGLSCPLCTGIYLSVGMVLLAFAPSKVGDVFLAWMGISGAQVFLENLTSDDAIQRAIEEVAESVEATT
jgi:hypothetical protein